MAENKKSFILYSDMRHTFDVLEDDEAGRLIKHLFKYVNDENPEPVDKITKVAFETIKQTLKRDLKKWEGTSVIRSNIGRLGGFASAKAKQAIGSKSKQLVAKASKVKQNQHDSVSVSDSVNVSEEKKNVDISIFDLTFERFIEMRKKKKAEPTEYAIDLLKKSLEKLAPGDQKTQIEILNKSIKNNWTDIYPLKNENGTDKTQRPNPTDRFRTITPSDGKRMGE